MFQLTLILSCLLTTPPQQAPFRVLAFYTQSEDAAHISFVREANQWFADMGKTHNFSYHATANWDSLNTETMEHFEVVIFLDGRPEQDAQRQAFRQYMGRGGGWLGFHFAGFALTQSTIPQNWNWYHVHFLGAGEYVSNTWRPTSAVLRVHSKHHPVTKGLPETFNSAPNEWYRWQIDMRNNPNIKILASIDPASFPLGTGPKPHEIWQKGFYPVAWTNTKYNMVYFNMGHNDIDYEHKTNKELSCTFSSESQNQMILQALMWVGRKSSKGQSVLNKE